MWGKAKRQMMDERGRITLPDLMFILMSLAFLGALYPVFWDGLQSNLDEIGTGEAYLFQLVLPVAILVMLSLIWVKTVAPR